MTNLPKLPKVVSGVRYPDGQLESQINAVMKTDPSAYIREVKKLMADIKEYQECLEIQGYRLEKLESLDPNEIYAKKVLIIR